MLALAGWGGGAVTGPLQARLEAPRGQTRLTREAEIRFGSWELVTALAWSPDGGALAVAAGDSIYIYRASDWGLVSSARLGAFTHGLDFSPDGRWLAAGSHDGVVRLWDAGRLLDGSSFEPVWAIKAHRKGVNAVRFNSQGTLLASAGNDAMARFWGMPDGEALGVTIGGSFAVPSVDFSLDGQVLAVVNGDMIRLREAASERIVGSFQSSAPLFHVEFSPNGEEIAAAGNDNLIRIWKTGQAFRSAQPVYPEPRLLAGHNGQEGTFRALVWAVVFSPDGSRLVSAGGDAMVRVWDVQSGELLSSSAAHAGGATSLAFQPDGGRVASGGLDGRVVIWALNP